MKHSSMRNMYRNRKKKSWMGDMNVVIQFLVSGHRYLTEYTVVPSLYSYLIYFIQLPLTHSHEPIKKNLDPTSSGCSHCFVWSALTFQGISGQWINLKCVSLSSYLKQRPVCFAWTCLAGQKHTRSSIKPLTRHSKDVHRHCQPSTFWSFEKHLGFIIFCSR